MNRFALVTLAACSLVACGPPLQEPTVTIGTEATLVKRSDTWFLSAPVDVRIGPDAAQYDITTLVRERSFTGFVSESRGRVDPKAGVFEVALTTSGAPRSGRQLELDLSVAVHVWDGALQVATKTETTRFSFMPR